MAIQKSFFSSFDVHAGSRWFRLCGAHRSLCIPALWTIRLLSGPLTFRFPCYSDCRRGRFPAILWLLGKITEILQFHKIKLSLLLLCANSSLPDRRILQQNSFRLNWNLRSKFQITQICLKLLLLIDNANFCRSNNRNEI